MGNWWINDSGQNTLKGSPQYETSDGKVFRAEFEAARHAALYNLDYAEWVDNNGQPGDPTNPMLLEDDFILHSLRTIAKARQDFFLMLPSLLPQEQDRLNNLIERCPFVLTPAKDPRDRADDLMKKFNTAGIHTTGLKGGSFGGP